MSTAVFSQGMESYNNSLFSPFTGQYRSWKGEGQYSYPAGVTAGNIRPLTNNDPTNNAYQRFGLPRPLKIYRKGKTTEPLITIVNPQQPNQYIQVNRSVRSSTGGSLVGQMIDKPGEFIVAHNPKTEVDETSQQDKLCSSCHGIGIVADFSPEPFLTNNPEPVSCSKTLCCNEEKKALKRVIPASTNLKKNYFTTLQQYRQNRCQTYDQKAFNFYFGPGSAITGGSAAAKPGSPLAEGNEYLANCYPNTDASIYSPNGIVRQLFEYMKLNGSIFTATDIANYYSKSFSTIAEYNAFLKTISGNKSLAQQVFTNLLSNPYLVLPPSGPSNPRGCKLTTYKPNNPQFATQGGVSSSTRLLKLTVTTIETNIANQKKRLWGSGNAVGIPETPFIYKSKTAPCNRRYYTKNGNPKTCFNESDDYFYKAVSKMGYVGGNINGTAVTSVSMGGAIV